MFRRAASMSVVLCLVACDPAKEGSGTPPAAPATAAATAALPPPAASAPPARCIVPLTEYCKARSCEETFESASAKLRTAIQSGANSWSGEIGRCGEYMYVASMGLGAWRQYFDTSGALVGGFERGDAPRQDSCGQLSYGRTYGVVPTCTPVPTETMGPSSHHR